jgi:hypothetical protein
LPGIELVRANSFLHVKAFIKEDFPTLLRPTNAIIGRLSAGKPSFEVIQALKVAEVILIVIYYLPAFFLL